MNRKPALLPILILSLIFSAPAFSAVENNQPAPDFSLTDLDGNIRSLSEFNGKFVVLEWVNHDCPFVKKHYDQGHMQALQAEYAQKGVVWLSINSSAEGKQGNYSPEEWKGLQAEKKSAATATLLDPEGKVGKLYGAQTTPHMYVVNPDGDLIYQGAIDSIKSTNTSDIELSENYVRSALDSALSGGTVQTPFSKAYGCSVKYKS
ncbi:MAG TPA: thioredoxin family protein [Candidatus Omnitrophota bacterium]|nr:thioredoxin family protein [Candidatus Omnitrophota bacterium]